MENSAAPISHPYSTSMPISSILGQFGNSPPTGQTRKQMEEYIKLQSNVMDLEMLRNRFLNPLARPTLTKFVYALTRLLFTDDEIMAPLRDINQQKIDWIYDESYRIFPGCTYSTVKNAVGQVGRTKRKGDINIPLIKEIIMRMRFNGEIPLTM